MKQFGRGSGTVRVESALSSSATPEKESIDIVEVTDRIQDDRAEDGEQDEVHICKGTPVRMAAPSANLGLCDEACLQCMVMKLK